MGGTWSSDVSNDTQSLLSAFPYFFCESIDFYDHKYFSKIDENLEIHVELPIEIEHGTYSNEHEVIGGAMSIQEDPTSYMEAINLSQKDQWKEAMQVEYDSLIFKGTWILTKIPSNHAPI